MGIFADMKAVGAVQKLKAGGTTQLSIAQITNLIINTQDANRNLSKEQFDAVWNKYCQMRKCTSKIPMDFQGYLETCVGILKEFDVIAPCEAYLGMEPYEAMLVMKSVREI